jgi:hypothetical protein
MTTFVLADGQAVVSKSRYLLAGHNVDGGEAQIFQRQRGSPHNPRDHV